MIRNRQDAMTLRHMVTIPSLLRFSYIPVLVLIVLLAIMVSARPSDGAQDAGPATLVAAGNKVNLELMEENDGQAIWTPAAAAELAEALAEIRGASTARPVADVLGVHGTRGAAVGAGNGVQVHALRLPSYILSCEAQFLSLINLS